jgi:uncharacterized protein (TIGR03083 family)
MSEIPQFAGVPLRDQDVRFDVSADEAVAAIRSHRLRLVDTVRGLSAADWAEQSRCSEWTVQGVVRHLVHVNRIQLESAAAARAGERFTGFAPDRFNPKTTPLELMRQEGDQDVATTLVEFEATTRAVLGELDDMPSDPDELVISTPVGRQPWHRASLHAVFDSAVHERDLLQPLGRTADAPADEVAVVAAYQVLVVARILALVGASADLALQLEGGPDLRVRVDGPVVSVQRGNLDGAPVQASGRVDAVLDAMVGRGELAAALSGPPEVVAGFGALATLV